MNDQPSDNSKTAEQAAQDAGTGKPATGKGTGGKTKVPEFTAEVITAALATMGFNVENTHAVLGYKPQFLDTSAEALGRCRGLVIQVQGEEAGKSAEPVALERYRKRVERMFAVLEQAAKPRAPATTGADLNSRMKLTDNGAKPTVATAGETAENAKGTSNPTDPVVATADNKTGKAGAKGRTAMAAKKKAAKKSATPKEPKEKKPGVIDTIVSILQAGGGTVEDIAAKLAKKFPDRKLDGLTATTKIQMSRLQTPKKDGGRGLKIKREKNEGSNALTYSIG